MKSIDARVALGLFIAALALRIGTLIVVPFDGLYGQDAFAYFGYMRDLRSALANLQPPPPFFWPLGYPLWTVLASLFVGPGAFAGQLVSMLSGALVPVFVYLICRDLGVVRPAALVAALLTATAAQLLISSLSFMSDAAGLAWVTASAWALLRYAHARRERWLVAASSALAMAVLTRWILALVAAPWSAAGWLAWRGRPFAWRRRLQHGGAALAVGVLIVGGQLAPDLVQGSLSHVGDLQVVGWNPTHALRRTIENSDGIFHYERPIGLYYALPLAHPAFVFPLLSPFLVIGLWALRRRAAPVRVLLIGWPLVVYVFLAGIAWENPRFALPLLPPLAVLGGLGVDSLWNAHPRWRALLIGWCALALLGSMAWAARDLTRFVAAKDSAVAAVRWAEAQVAPDAVVITFGLTGAFGHYTNLQVVELYNETPATLRAVTCDSAPAYLLLDPSVVETQWIGRAPQVNYQWLDRNAGLEPVGAFGGYSLFEIGRPAACELG
ncbi:MAG: ArnT family glycosyltransferase [Anaerolineales bacterium]